LIIDRKDFRDDLFSDYESAFKFLQQYLRLEYEIKDAGPRKEIPEIPYEALRESLLNAIIHRDYSVEGARIMVEIFDDRVEISNPGELLFDVSKLGRASIARNPIVFDLFNRLGLVEKVGSGISRIRSTMGERGLNVRFETDGFFTVIFQRPQLKEILSKDEPQLTEKEISILNMCSETTLSTKEISRRVGYSRLSTYRLLSGLIENGLVTYTIPDKLNSPNQRYKTTKKGLEYLNQLSSRKLA
jgi:ATP-dependent DNA helicase RecG